MKPYPFAEVTGWAEEDREIIYERRFCDTNCVRQSPTASIPGSGAIVQQ